MDEGTTPAVELKKAMTPIGGTSLGDRTERVWQVSDRILDFGRPGQRCHNFYGRDHSTPDEKIQAAICDPSPLT